MNRRERRRWRSMAGSDVQYTRDLEREITRLRNEVQGLKRVHNVQALVIEETERQGKLEITLSEDVPGNGVYINAAEAVQQMNAYRELSASANEFTDKLRMLELIVMRVDAAAAYCTLSDLPGAVQGLDAQLAGAFTAVAGAAQLANMPTEPIRAIAGAVTARVNALHKVRRDQGKELRDVVAQTSAFFAQTAEQLQTKARQGRMREPRTLRLVDYARRWKYEAGRTWDEAAADLLAELHQRAAELDPVDTEILADLETREVDARGDYLRTVYHKAQR